MYGINYNTQWFDYDLISAYTTAIAIAGIPFYDDATFFQKQDKFLKFLNSQELFSSFSSFKVSFQFPPDTKFPNLPVILDDNSTIYPLKGITITNGFSLKVALDNHCDIKLLEGCIIPFMHTNKSTEQNPQFFLPFFESIHFLQSERRKHSKGTFNNLFFKLMGNALYGNIAIGLSRKPLFDSLTKSIKPLNPTNLTNPIIASFITDFIRATLSEILNKSHSIGGNNPNLSEQDITKIAKSLKVRINLKDVHKIITQKFLPNAVPSTLETRNAIKILQKSFPHLNTENLLF